MGPYVFYQTNIITGLVKQRGFHHVKINKKAHQLVGFDETPRRSNLSDAQTFLLRHIDTCSISGDCERKSSKVRTTHQLRDFLVLRTL